MNNKNDIFEKSKKVIHSCKNLDHIKTCKRYIKMSLKYLDNDQQDYIIRLLEQKSRGLCV